MVVTDQRHKPSQGQSRASGNIKLIFEAPLFSAFQIFFQLIFYLKLNANHAVVESPHDQLSFILDTRTIFRVQAFDSLQSNGRGYRQGGSINSIEPIKQCKSLFIRVTYT